jgi:hypothetical protein
MEITKAVSDLTVAVGKMPAELKLSTIEAINAQKVACDRERKSITPKSPSTKLLTALIGVIVACLAIISALVGIGCGAAQVTDEQRDGIKACTDICFKSEMITGCFTDYVPPGISELGSALVGATCIASCTQLYLAKEDARDRLKCLARAQECKAIKWCDSLPPPR